MVRIQQNIYLNDEEEFVASIVASVAELKVRKAFFRAIGRFRQSKSKLAFHQNNIDIVRQMGISRNLPSLLTLAKEFQAIIDKYQ